MPALAVVVCAVAFVALALDTGVGTLSDDGAHYGYLVTQLRGGDGLLPRDPLAFRILPAVIVAASGLDLRLGYFALGTACTMGSALLLVALLRRYGASPAGALIAVACFAALPFTVRLTLHRPVLTDAVALFLTLALMHAAIARRPVLFAVLLVLGALTRESTLVVAPFYWIAAMRTRRLPAALAASVAGFAAFTVVRIAPPVPPDPNVSETAGLLRYHIGTFLLNTNDRALRYVLAIPLSLGVLVAIPFGVRGQLSRLVAREPEWLYLAFAMLFTSLVGGVEPDRYDTSLAAVALLAFASGVAWSVPLAAALVSLQLVAGRAFVPWTAATDTSFSVASGDLGSLAFAALVSILCGVAAALLVRRADHSPTNF